MSLDRKENYKEVRDKIQKERRSFLKKTVYAAPSLIVMGQLAKPTRSNAFEEDPGPTPSDPRV